MSGNRSRQRSLGNLLLLLTAIIWGMAFAFQRAGMDYIGPLTFTAVRMACAAVVVGAVAIAATLRKRRTQPLPPETVKAIRRREVTGGICCGCFLTAANTVQQTGLLYTTAGKAGFITALYILLVPLVSFLFFRKKIHRRIWLAVALGILGLYLLCVNESLRLTRGDALMCLSALLFCGHILCCDHFAPRGNPVRISAIQFLTVTVLSGVLALFLEKPTWAGILTAAVPILYCGVVSAGIGYTLQMTAQKVTDPSIASLLMSLESVFAVLGGALILHERMTGRELLGCAVMFAAILLAQVPLPELSRE